MNQSIVLILLATSVLCDQWRYKLAVEWPGAVCRTNKCQSQYMGTYDGQAWNMHGLWPDKQTATICTSQYTCTSEPYKPSQFGSSTLSQINKYWVGLYNSQDSFRDHEWTKHGTCWSGAPLAGEENGVQESYFKTVMALHRRYEVLNGLREVGVVPSSSQTYSFTTIVNGFKNVLSRGSGGMYVTDSMMEIQCSKDPVTGKSQLFQVYLCLDSNYLPMNCNCNQSYTGVNNGCASDVLYPPFAMTEQ